MNKMGRFKTLDLDGTKTTIRTLSTSDEWKVSDSDRVIISMSDDLSVHISIEKQITEISVGSHTPLFIPTGIEYFIKPYGDMVSKADYILLVVSK